MLQSIQEATVDSKSDLQARWKRTIRKWPLARRAAWLNSPEGHAAFESRQRWDKLNHIRERILTLVRQVPSDTWLDMSQFYGDQFPPGGARSEGGSTLMVLSKGRVRIGMDDIPTRRFTPPQCVLLESFLDRMDVLDAAHYEHPPSVTGLQIARIGLFKGREEKEKQGPRKSGSKRNKQKIFSSPPVETTYENFMVKIVAPERAGGVDE